MKGELKLKLHLCIGFNTGEHGCRYTGHFS